MYQKALLILTLTASTYIGMAQQATKEYYSPNMWTNYTLQVPGVDEINLFLFFREGGAITGYYFEQCSIKITLQGTIKQNDVSLMRYRDGKAEGMLTYKVQLDSISMIANWSDATITKITIGTISPNNSLYGTADSRHEFNYGTDEQLMTFMKEVAKAIANDDKEWLAEHIEYPYKNPFLKGAKAQPDKVSFIKNYKLEVTDAVKTSVAEACPYESFSNFEGIALGDVLIGLNSDASPTKWHYRIIRF